MKKSLFSLKILLFFNFSLNLFANTHLSPLSNYNEIFDFISISFEEMQEMEILKKFDKEKFVSFPDYKKSTSSLFTLGARFCTCFVFIDEENKHFFLGHFPLRPSYYGTKWNELPDHEKEYRVIFDKMVKEIKNEVQHNNTKYRCYFFGGGFKHQEDIDFDNDWFKKVFRSIGINQIKIIPPAKNPEYILAMLSVNLTSNSITYSHTTRMKWNDYEKSHGLNEFYKAA